MPKRDQLQEFVAWCAKPITADETFWSGASVKNFLDRQSDWTFLPAA